jgi:prepilin-type N-terminal cleavage/methylation domain-containing protein
MNTEKNGFTVMEIVIVAIVFAIVACVAVPKLSQAADQAECSYLCKALQKVRSGIALYKIDHNDSNPGTGNANWTEAMTAQTNEDGDLYTPEMQAAGIKPCGPYIKTVPKNPYTDLNTVEVSDIDLGMATATTGWYFNTESAHFRANDLNDHIHY